MRTIIALILSITILSCGGKSDSSEREALYNKVMDVHDAVMPKMDDIYKQKTALTEKLATKPADSLEIRQKITKLDAADKAMMDWMHQFNPPDEKTSDEEAKTYLEDQYQKVTEMQKFVDEAIAGK